MVLSSCAESAWLFDLVKLRRWGRVSAGTPLTTDAKRDRAPMASAEANPEPPRPEPLVAVLEQIARALDRIERRFDGIEWRLEAIERRQHVWLLGLYIAGYVLLLAILAHGFHWI
jgi:hypothetical protein